MQYLKSNYKFECDNKIFYDTVSLTFMTSP